MVRIIGSECMLHISFGMAAFVFGVVLYILIRVLGFGGLSDSGCHTVLLLLAVFFANVLLTYYLALYVEGFYGDYKYKRSFFIINLILVISSAVLTASIYIYQIVSYKGEAVIDTVPIEWRRLTTGTCSARLRTLTRPSLPRMKPIRQNQTFWQILPQTEGCQLV